MMRIVVTSLAVLGLSGCVIADIDDVSHTVTPSAIQRLDPAIGAHNESGLRDWGFDPAQIASLKASGAL